MVSAEFSLLSHGVRRNRESQRPWPPPPPGPSSCAPDSPLRSDRILRSTKSWSSERSRSAFFTLLFIGAYRLPGGVAATIIRRTLIAGACGIVGVALLVPATLLFEGLPSSLDGLAILGLSFLATVGGALACLLWFSGIARLAPTQISFLTLLTPVVATLLGWVALDQSLTLLQGCGAVLALGAAVVTQLPSKTPEGSTELQRNPRRHLDGVPPLGLEPRTNGLKVHCANQLRHRGAETLPASGPRLQRRGECVPAQISATT